jgi:hypothetical protein
MCANIRVPSSLPCTQYRLTAWPAYNCTLFVLCLETRNFNQINYPLADETCQNWKNDVLLTFKWPFCHVGIEFSVLLMLKMTLQTQCSCAGRPCMMAWKKLIFDDSDCWNRHQTSSFTRSGVRMTERDRRRQSTWEFQWFHSLESQFCQWAVESPRIHARCHETVTFWHNFQLENDHLTPDFSSSDYRRIITDDKYESTNQFRQV